MPEVHLTSVVVQWTVHELEEMLKTDYCVGQYSVVSDYSANIETSHRWNWVHIGKGGATNLKVGRGGALHWAKTS